MLYRNKIIIMTSDQGSLLLKSFIFLPNILSSYLFNTGGSDVAGVSIQRYVNLLGENTDVGQDEDLDHVRSKLLQIKCGIRHFNDPSQIKHAYCLQPESISRSILPFIIAN